jgi:SAM-dependent methyltransferase
MTSKTLSTEDEIGLAYEGNATAANYVAQRFRSEVHALLHEHQVATVNRWLSQLTECNALEIAPGPGRVTRDIRWTNSLTCLEFNDGMIEEGKRNCRNDVRWVRGNAFELPFSEQFDYVFSFRFVRHFHRDDRARLYEQIRGVLRPGGMFTLDAVNAVVSRPLREANPEAYPVYDKLYEGEWELRTELRKEGLEVVELKPVQRWYSAQYRAQVVLGPRSRLLCRAAIRTLERLRRGPALEWIVTCRRV